SRPPPTSSACPATRSRRPAPPPAPPGTCAAPPAAPPAVRRPRSPPASPRWPTAPTAAAPCASPPPAAGSSGSNPPAAWSPQAPTRARARGWSPTGCSHPPGPPPPRPRRADGGPSGAAAPAVASGLAPLAHGTDGGGSVRIPAACCGIVGIKPTRGLVSPGPYSGEGMGLVTDGTLARTVRDAAAGLDLIAGTRPGDFMPWPRRGGSYLEACEEPQRPLRIGVLTQPLAAETEVHPAALRGVDRAVELLDGLGHETTAIPAPFTAAQW